MLEEATQVCLLLCQLIFLTARMLVRRMLSLFDLESVRARPCNGCEYTGQAT